MHIFGFDVDHIISEGSLHVERIHHHHIWNSFLDESTVSGSCVAKNHTHHSTLFMKMKHGISTAFAQGRGVAQPVALGIRLYHPINSATASSTYSGSGTTSGESDSMLDMFKVDKSLSPEAGYWCSSGADPPNKEITWQGDLDQRFPAYGLKVDWAYAPSWVKVEYSPDGKHFQTAIDWKQEDTGYGNEAYAQDLLFDTVKNVKALKIVMKGGQPWTFVGINQAALIASQPIYPAGADDHVNYPEMNMTGMNHANPNMTNPAYAGAPQSANNSANAMNPMGPPGGATQPMNNMGYNSQGTGTGVSSMF